MNVVLWVKIEMYKLLGDSDQKKKKKTHGGRREQINNFTRVPLDHELGGSIALTGNDLGYYSQIFSVVKFDLFLKNHVDTLTTG